MRTSTETRGVTDRIRGRASRLALLCVQRTAGRRWTAGLLELEIELRPTPISMIGAFVMPSPFPGMDPFIESQRWQDFHGWQRALRPQSRDSREIFSIVENLSSRRFVK